MKYKVGDKVRIVKEMPKICMIEEMRCMLGKEVTIREVGEYYSIEEFGFVWTDECFEGLVEEQFEEGEMIEVSNDGKKWHKAIFLEKEFVCVALGDEEIYSNKGDYYTTGWNKSRKLKNTEILKAKELLEKNNYTVTKN